MSVAFVIGNGWQVPYSKILSVPDYTSSYVFFLGLSRIQQTVRQARADIASG